MARAFQKIAWIGSFFGSRKDWWDVGAVVSLDLKSRVIAYRPWLTVGSKAPRELLVEWTLPFADVRELSQPGIKFGVLAATGYRGLVRTNRARSSMDALDSPFPRTSMR
jgi:hypothetical protein